MQSIHHLHPAGPGSADAPGDGWQREEWLRLAVEAAGIGTWHWDLRTGEQAWSARQRAIFGLEADGPVIPAQVMALVHEEDRARVEATVARCLRDNTDCEIVFRIETPAGEQRWVQARGRAYADETGAPVHMAGIALDVTREKRQQHEIEALNARLQRSVRESHHRIKNNLQVVAALTELQANATADAGTTATLERIGAHVRSLAAIHDLLTRDPEGDMPEAGVSSRAAMDKLVPALRVLLGDRPLDCVVADTPLPLRQVTALAILANELVSNAAKHGQGAVKVRLTVSEPWPAERERRRWQRARLEVCDQGPGFPPEFDPRRSGHLGMELVEGVARWDLQGAVTYGTLPDGGGRVVVTFPLTPQ